jgi:uncharacterized protein YcfJ
LAAPINYRVVSMSKSFVIGAVAGAIVVTAGGATAGYKMYSAAHSANVLSAKAVTHKLKIPHKECHDETITHTKPVKDRERLLGTGLGAVVGGLLGHQVGGGSGKTLATVAGAAAGGYAGNKIQQKTQQGDTYTTTEQRCITAYDIKEEPAGFEVVYEYKGQQHHVHTDRDPGRALPVKDGKVDVASFNDASGSAQGS